MVAKGMKYATKSKSTAEVIRNAMWKDMQRQSCPLPQTGEYWVGEFKAWNAIKSGPKQVQSNARVAERFLREQKVQRVHDITMREVVHYLNDLKKEKVKDRTVQAHRNALHLFCKFLVMRGELHLNPVDPVPVANPQKEDPGYLSDRAVGLLLRRVEKKCPKILLAVQVALWAGPRLSSLRALKWSHVGENALMMPLPKTKGYTVVPLDRMDPRLKEVLKGGRGSMFENHDPKWWNTELKKATGLMPMFGQIKGPGGQWHLLRATWAVNRAREGATLWELMAWGGWTVPQTVMRYVNLARASG
jgi:integrase